MYKQIDFTKLGGYPLTQDTLNYMQDGYNAVFAALSNFIGDKVILTGVDIVGGNVSDGWVSVNGEILPFVGGPLAVNCIAIDATDNRLFFDNTNKTVLKKRSVVFGGPGGFLFSDLVKLGTLKNMFYSLCPKDSVIPYEGNIGAIPFGWQLHTLTRGRVLIGLDEQAPGTADPDFDTLGKTGGEKKHQPTIPEMAEHDHGEVGSFDGGGSQGFVLDTNNQNGTGPNLSMRTAKTGGNQPFNVLNPYYVIGFIKKMI